MVSLISSLLSIFIYINFFQINKITDIADEFGYYQKGVKVLANTIFSTKSNSQGLKFNIDYKRELLFETSTLDNVLSRGASSSQTASFGIVKSDTFTSQTGSTNLSLTGNNIIATASGIWKIL